MMEYLERANNNNIKHAEVFFNPQTHTENNIGFDVFMPGFQKAIDEAKEK